MWQDKVFSLGCLDFLVGLGSSKQECLTSCWGCGTEWLFWSGKVEPGVLSKHSGNVENRQWYPHSGLFLPS